MEENLGTVDLITPYCSALSVLYCSSVVHLEIIIVLNLPYLG